MGTGGGRSSSISSSRGCCIGRIVDYYWRQSEMHFVQVSVAWNVPVPRAPVCQVVFVLVQGEAMVVV